MKLLLIHRHFPGQWRHIATHAIRNGHSVMAIGEQGITDPAKSPAGVQLVGYTARGASSTTHQYLQGTEAAVRRGQGVARAVLAVKEKGFVPDVVCVHHGWGEGLYLKDVLPGVPILTYCEFYYHGYGVDLDFDREYPGSFDDRLRVRTRNGYHVLSLLAAERGLAPTRWQQSLWPPELRGKISVIHEGIDTNRVKPDSAASFTAPGSGQVFRAGEETVTYVARNLEPYRGFHIFMRTLPELQRRRPNAQFIVVGGDKVSYGRQPKGHKTWREAMLAEVGDRVDLTRVHFVGNLDYDSFLSMLRVSAAHIYLTYPFVLSWSMLEAMASECIVIGSSTAPVKEVIRDRENGLLVDFFSPQQICDAADFALSGGPAVEAIRKAARQTVIANYEQRECIEAQWRLIEQLVADATRQRSAAAGLQPAAPL
jgi:glycosyltransferase involved in cell wall biosynthesis